MMVLDLSMGATLFTSPGTGPENRRPGRPCGKAESTRNKHVLALIKPMVSMDPVRNTMIHENNNNTTPVRIAVATSESVSLTPIFDKTAVRPANKVDPKANKAFYNSPVSKGDMYTSEMPRTGHGDQKHSRQDMQFF